MRLRTIAEKAVELNDSPSDVVETLEILVDNRRGKIQPNDVIEMVNYLTKFPPTFLKKVAALLGTNDYTAKGMADKIAQGDLIRYYDDDGGEGIHHTSGSHEYEDHERDDMWDVERLEDSEYQPSTEDLKAIESGETGSAGGFRSSPPAFEAQNGGSPAIAQIPPKLIDRLKHISPNNLIDSPSVRPEVHQPFIYIGGAKPKLLVGPKDEFHSSIIYEIEDPVESKLVNNVYNSGEKDKEYNYIKGSAHPGVVGRIGYNLGKLNPILNRATFVAMYARSGSTEHPQTVNDCIKALITANYIPRDALVIYAGHLLTATEMVGGMETKLSEQDILRSEYQAAYHVGTWPNGKRMTPAEKADLGRRLGMTSGGMKKNPWQDNMERAGIINPGQKWWAPTSESKGV